VVVETVTVAIEVVIVVVWGPRSDYIVWTI
jgi:hypothetical protein